VERAEQLTLAVSVTQQLVDAVARGTVSADLADFAAATIGADQLDVAPSRLRQTTLPDAPGVSITPAIARVLVMNDWVGPIHQAIVTGYPQPPVPAAPLDHEATGVLGNAAYHLGTAAKRSGDWAAAAEWWRLATQTGHPRAARALRGVEGRHPRPRWQRLAARSAIAVLVLALVAWLVIRALGPDRSELPQTVRDLVPACEGTLYPDAADYAGGPPHPTAVFDTTPGTDRGGLDLVIAGDTTLSESWRPDDPRQVQAVACVNQLDTGSTLNTCYYTGAATLSRSGVPFALMERRYRVTVFSLREHRQLHQAEFVGADDQCPEKVLATGPHLVYTRPTVEQFADAIGNIVDP
jgi:hypothetical protein